MKRIHQLSRQLINQIAAGEVIERPASVVKELLENAIDAGATKIEIEITNECKNIRVSDNGSGIHPDDIELAFSKHATSKIQSSDDLFNIHSLGFRGEALASIISIAKVTCTTRTKEHETGTKVECEESNVKRTPCGCAQGTTMEVRDLFYNVPVREKFLKSERVEFSYISEIVQSAAIANPSVAITLKGASSTPVQTSGSGDLLCVLTEIYSNSIAAGLKEIQKNDETDHISVSGYCSTPDFTRSSKKAIYVFVNNRVVKCPVILKAIDTAYKNMLPSGKYPFVCLNLSIRPKDVDVNVHPTKREVRYKNPNLIFNFIYSAVIGALNGVQPYTPAEEDYKPVNSAPEENLIKTFFNNYSPKDNSNEESQDKPVSYPEQTALLTETQREYTYKKPDTSFSFNKTETIRPLERIPDITPEIPSYNIIGQYLNTYIIFEENRMLNIIDQHIADERYIFEKLKEQLSEKDVPSQLLIISDVIKTEPEETALLMENREKLARFGYGIEQISDTEITFKKIPQVISHFKPQDILADILENLQGDLNNLEEKMLVTMSCKAAVKAGQELNLWQMEELIKKWKTTKHPYTCPHGRPILHTFSPKEIGAFFHRNEN